MTGLLTQGPVAVLGAVLGTAQVDDPSNKLNLYYDDNFSFFPKRNFNNYRKGKLEKQVTIVPGSRHEQLVAAMAKGVVVGIYFPNCLQGFSVYADREQMATLPEQFLLAGGFEASACMIAYPDVLARDNNTPLLDLAALQWQSAGYSLCFNADGDCAYFGSRSGLGSTYGNYAGGLVVLG